MKRRLLALFSGFPARRFPEAIGKRLGSELTCRDSLVFVSAWPEDFAGNDRDSTGMYGMFEEYRIFFARRCVIDHRTEAAQARQLIQDASCVFLMGGHPGLQMRLLREKKLDCEIRDANAAVLGVSAGSINMAKRSLDTKDSPVPYDGLGLVDLTVKPHFSVENEEVLSTLLRISYQLPICAMEDNSAIFVKGGEASFTGAIHRMSEGKMVPLSQDHLKAVCIETP